MEISQFHTDFAFYSAFIKQLFIFYIPAIVGVICSISVAYFKSEDGDFKFIPLAHRIFVWASPAAVLMCIIELFIGQSCSDETRLALYGVTFFAGMVGKDLSIMCSNLHTLLKLSKSLLNDISDKMDNVKSISEKLEKISDGLEDDSGVTKRDKDNKKENSS